RPLRAGLGVRRRHGDLSDGGRRVRSVGVGGVDPGRRPRRRLVDPGPLPEAGMTVEARGVSKWFGQKVALSEVTVDFEPGVTGLLGPNGAGKTTLLRVLTGLQVPSQGEVSVLGVDPRADRSVYARVAMVPEDEAIYPDLTARRFVELKASLAGVTDPAASTEAAIATVGLSEAADRRMGG